MAQLCSDSQASSLGRLTAIRLPLSPPIVGVVVLLQLKTIAGYIDEKLLFGAKLLEYLFDFSNSKSSTYR